jgi:hypothetical protein
MINRMSLNTKKQEPPRKIGAAPAFLGQWRFRRANTGEIEGFHIGNLG